jgi:plasmid stabilization system protein ParE
MKREVMWTWAAEADLQQHYSELEDRTENAGGRLLVEVEKATLLLLAFPLLAARWRPPVRRMILRRRKLALFYVPEPRGIVVIAVADLRRDPDSLWHEIRSRLPS